MVEKYKSGFAPPTDLPFEDLSSAENVSVNGSMSSIQTSLPGSAEKRTILGTITGGRVKKRSGLLGLFSNNKVKEYSIFKKEELYRFAFKTENETKAKKLAFLRCCLVKKNLCLNERLYFSGYLSCRLIYLPLCFVVFLFIFFFLSLFSQPFLNSPKSSLLPLLLLPFKLLFGWMRKFKNLPTNSEQRSDPQH